MRTRNPEALTILTIVVLLVVGIPLSYAFWYFRDFLVYLGLFFLGIVIIACLCGVAAMAGWAISKYRVAPLAIPLTKDGAYLVRGKRVERLVPLTVPEQTIVEASPRRVNHVPVHINYAIQDDPPPPEAFDDELYDIETTEIGPTYEEGLEASARNAYENGAKSGEKMYKALNDLGYEVTVRQCREIVKQLKEEKR